MKLYYSHDELIYGTRQEDADCNMMGTLGINVLNPNSPVYQERIQMFREYGQEDQIEPFINELIDKCDGVIFRTLPDGSKSAQMEKDIAKAQADGKPVLQIPTLE